MCMWVRLMLFHRSKAAREAFSIARSCIASEEEEEEVRMACIFHPNPLCETSTTSKGIDSSRLYVYMLLSARYRTIINNKTPRDLLYCIILSMMHIHRVRDL